jgi:hypothetical protein
VDFLLVDGDGAHTAIRGVGMVDQKLTLEKIVQLKNICIMSPQ